MSARRHLSFGCTLLCAALTFSSVVGCGASSRSTRSRSEPRSRTLSETRALTLITEALADQSIPTGPSWTVPIGPGQELEVDIRLAQSSFGIEWVSPQDRADLGGAIPGPAEGGHLRIVPGYGSGHEADQVLILHHWTYDFVNEREHVQAGYAGARETEERLRRDVLDFVHYLQGQGGL